MLGKVDLFVVDKKSSYQGECRAHEHAHEDEKREPQISERAAGADKRGLNADELILQILGDNGKSIQEVKWENS